MERVNDALESIKSTVEAINSLRNTAFYQYGELVDLALKNRITDEHRLEQIMDGLLDFCDEARFIELYRTLCRHVYYQYPQLVGEHIALFRAQFESVDSSKDD